MKFFLKSHRTQSPTAKLNILNIELNEADIRALIAYHEGVADAENNHVGDYIQKQDNAYFSPETNTTYHWGCLADFAEAERTKADKLAEKAHQQGIIDNRADLLKVFGFEPTAERLKNIGQKIALTKLQELRNSTDSTKANNGQVLIFTPNRNQAIS